MSDTPEPTDAPKPEPTISEDFEPQVAEFFGKLLASGKDPDSLRIVEIVMNNFSKIAPVSSAISLKRIADSLERLAGHPNTGFPLPEAIYNAISTALFEDRQRRS